MLTMLRSVQSMPAHGGIVTEIYTSRIVADGICVVTSLAWRGPFWTLPHCTLLKRLPGTNSQAH